MDTVFHKTFGKGTVISKEGCYLTVDFSGNMKKFIYPDAFFSHLTYEDEKKQTEILEIIEKKRTEEKNAQIERLTAENRKKLENRLKRVLKTRNSLSAKEKTKK